MIAFKEKVKFSFIFNQVPNYKPMHDLLEKWMVGLKIKIPFVENYIQIAFDEETNYLNTIQQILLPEDNLVFIALNDQIASNL